MDLISRSSPHKQLALNRFERCLDYTIVDVSHSNPHEMYSKFTQLELTLIKSRIRLSNKGQRSRQRGENFKMKEMYATFTQKPKTQNLLRQRNKV